MSLFLFLFIILLFLFNSVTSTAMSYNILSSSGNYIVSTALPNKNVFVVMSTSSGASYMIYDDTGSVIKELTLLNATETTQLSSYAAGANLKAISNDLVVLAEGKNFHLITVADGIITKSVQWITSSITSTFISLFEFETKSTRKTVIAKTTPKQIRSLSHIFCHMNEKLFFFVFENSSSMLKDSRLLSIAILLSSFSRRSATSL